MRVTTRDCFWGRVASSWSQLCLHWDRKGSQMTTLVCANANAQGAWQRRRCQRRVCTSTLWLSLVLGCAVGDCWWGSTMSGHCWRFSVLQPCVWRVLKWSSKRVLKGITRPMDSQKLQKHKIECWEVTLGTQRTVCRGTESKQMCRRQISGAQENVGDVNLSSLEKKSHFLRSRYGGGTLDMRCGENGWRHWRWSSRAHWRVIVPLRAWTAERHETSAEDRGPTVGQRIHPKVPRSSVDAQWRRAGNETTTSTCSGDACGLKHSSKRHNWDWGRSENKMWRGTDRRWDVRLAQLWQEECREWRSHMQMSARDAWTSSCTLMKRRTGVAPLRRRDRLG